MASKYQIRKGKQRSSAAQREQALIELRRLRAECERIETERVAIIKAHPGLTRLAAERRALQKPINDAQYEACRYQYEAVTYGSIFTTIFAHGDTRAECFANAEKKKA